MTYVTNEVKPTRAPEPIRERERDWLALSPLEQKGVLLHQADIMRLDAVPLRGQVFLRRHGRNAHD